jgi:hypothetical protein
VELKQQLLFLESVTVFILSLQLALPHLLFPTLARMALSNIYLLRVVVVEVVFTRVVVVVLVVSWLEPQSLAPSLTVLLLVGVEALELLGAGVAVAILPDCQLPRAVVVAVEQNLLGRV